MAILTFPNNIRPTSMDWWLVDNTQSHQSPLSKTVQTIELPGSHWRASLVFEDWRRYEIAELEAFLVALRGGAGRFYLWHHARETPRGIATGTPLVNGAGQSGASLITDGWTANQVGILLPGDYIGVNNELKMVIESVDSDAGGNATLKIEPPLRASPPDNAIITTTKPLGKFMRISSADSPMRHRRSLSSVTLDIMEDIT